MRISFILSIAALLLSSTTGLAQQTHSPDLRNEMLWTISYIERMVDIQYAPKEWKQKHFQWDLDKELSSARTKIQTQENLNIKDFHVILDNFFASMKDYHVGVSFVSTERSKLPFLIRSGERNGDKTRFFITWIDQTKASTSAFPFKAGDELVTFNGQPTIEAVNALKNRVVINVEETDQSMAELMLTNRNGASGLPAPQGSALLGIKRQGSQKVSEVQLAWEYTPEYFDFTRPIPIKANSLSPSNWNSPFSLTNPIENSVLNTKMENPVAQSMVQQVSNPHWIGFKKSYIPALGTKVWTAEENKNFDSYIYKNKEGKLIGYVRIPSYVPTNPSAAVKEFAALMTKFEESTEGLVIDQINNPGGSVFYLYALASTLTDQALYTPRHQITLNTSMAENAYKLLEQLRSISNEEQAKAALGEDIHGYPISYQLIVFLREYARFILKEWNLGKTLTDLTHLHLVDRINPYPNANYTKPVLILVNELDFSGGDFFPAIMQDNKRATIMGMRTAGAGGFVTAHNVPNRLGVAGFRLTGSLAERIDQNPIENLGVVPDIAYSLTDADLEGGFAKYATAIKSAIDSLIKEKN